MSGNGGRRQAGSRSRVIFSIIDPMAHNVKVVYDVFGVAIKELRSSFSNPKNVAEKKSTKGASPTGFFRSPSRFSGEAYTILLCAVGAYTIILLIFLNLLFHIYDFQFVSFYITVFYTIFTT
jgi:hypothetical protein